MKEFIYNSQGELIKVINEDADKNKIYLHLSMTDGDGMEPIGIVNNGTDTINVTAALRVSDDIGSPIIPYSKAWRIIIRESGNKIYDQIKVAMVNGVISFNYHTVGAPAICRIDPSDMTETFDIQGDQYLLEVLGNTEFKVYRDFT